MDIKIPHYVSTILHTLKQSGFESFVVGGCVRDVLMEKTPADWDICTAAKPEQIKAVFSGYKTIDIGIKHGTVAVLTSGGPLEITTYRIDGTYLDNRHPEKVEFTSNLTEDLARRDFTMNAMAYHPEDGLRDPFAGQRAIADGLIQCVGEPARRFEEDSLRILRGLRFAAVLGFQIEEESAAAMRKCANFIKNVSVERVNVELSKLIMGDSADEILQDFEEVIKTAAPGFKLTPVNDVPRLLPVRLALLFPEDTETTLRWLKYDNYTIKTAAILSDLFKETQPEGNPAIKKLLCSRGEEVTKMYFKTLGRLPELEEILQSGQCYNIRQLAVSGADLLTAGMPPGKKIGEILEHLLQLVMENKIENEKEHLLREVDSLLES